MRDSRHNQEVEHSMREHMHIDKARHEVGQISGFGLMQISRQRLRPAATTTTYISCPMCEGHGSVRTVESAALSGLRKIHNRISLGDVESMRVAVPTGVAAYLLNQKRDELARLESRYRCSIHVELREDLMPHQIEIDVIERRADAIISSPTVSGVVAAPAESTAEDRSAGSNGADGPTGSQRKRRRRGRRRGGRSRGNGAATEQTQNEAALAVPNDGDTAEVAQPDTAAPAAASESSRGEETRSRSGSRRRRSSRGRGRRSSQATAAASAEARDDGTAAKPLVAPTATESKDTAGTVETIAETPPAASSIEASEAKKKTARGRATKRTTKRTSTAPKTAAADTEAASDKEKAAKPARKAATKKRRTTSTTKRTRKTTKKKAAKKPTKADAKPNAETVA
jgi:ribonuclease E